MTNDALREALEIGLRYAKDNAEVMRFSLPVYPLEMHLQTAEHVRKIEAAIAALPKAQEKVDLPMTTTYKTGVSLDGIDETCQEPTDAYFKAAAHPYNQFGTDY